YLMRAKLLDGRSQTFLMCDFLFSVFIYLIAGFSLLCFFKKCKCFFEDFLGLGFAPLWKTSLLIFPNKAS
ncbi:MAG: hypothetical protein Q4F61_03425, partial [Candidatus Saccharibacteria bacterium]|nr:hypothetical protein [Candidatus Saccharibacteria bacterium]